MTGIKRLSQAMEKIWIKNGKYLMKSQMIKIREVILKTGITSFLQKKINEEKK